MIYVIGIIITFFLSFILLTKKGKSISDKILVVWLFVIALHLILYYIISTQHLQFTYLLGLEIPMPLLHGPFLFLYTTSFTAPQTSTRRKLFHLLPFTLALFSLIPFFLLSSEEKLLVYRNKGEPFSILTGIIFLCTALSGMVYIALSLRSLIKHKRKIKDEYSYTEKINLQWLFNLTIGLCCIWVIVLLADDEFIFSAVVLYVFFIGYFGIKQVGIFTNQRPATSFISLDVSDPADVITVQPDNSKYDKSSLTDRQLETIHAELLKLMRHKKLYLIPELTLSMVAGELEVHPNTLSQVINRAEKKNFFDYINTLRVSDFKEKAANPENHKYTLLSLAYDCGFNSKTSFNRNFKKISGKSPSDYLKEAQIILK